MKQVVTRLAKWAGLTCDLEVYGLFKDAIPQVARTRLQQRGQRDRQGLVPDFRFSGKIQGLAELKTIGRCPTYYHLPGSDPPGHRQWGRKPVDHRALSIQGEYEAKLRRIDSPNGRLVTRLHSFGQVQGFVVGAYGELSRDFVGFVHAVVETKLGSEAKFQRAGASYLYTHVRRQLGVAAVCAFATQHSRSLCYCGPGGKALYDARRQAKQRSYRYSADLQAQWYCDFHKTNASLHGTGARAMFGKW